MRREKLADEEFLSGWDDKKNVEQCYATIGNLGRLTGPSKEQWEHMKKQKEAIKELWNKTMQVYNRKRAMGDGIVNEDRLQGELDLANRRLVALTADLPRSVSPMTCRSEKNPVSITSEVNDELNQDIL